MVIHELDLRRRSPSFRQEVVKEIGRATQLPVIAIGGINEGNVAAVIRGGAHGVAVISAVAEAEDMLEATSALLRLIREARRSTGEEEQNHDTV